MIFMQGRPTRGAARRFLGLIETSSIARAGGGEGRGVGVERGGVRVGGDGG